jgi:hypothetical protein
MAPPPSFQYIECDIPEGVSISEWRHERAQPATRRQRIRALLHRVRRGLRR